MFRCSTAHFNLKAEKKLLVYRHYSVKRFFICIVIMKISMIKKTDCTLRYQIQGFSFRLKSKWEKNFFLNYRSFDIYIFRWSSTISFPFCLLFSTYSSLSLPDVAWNGRWPHQRQCTVCLVILLSKAYRQTGSIKPRATIWLCRGLVCQDQRCPPMDPNRSWQTHYCDQSRHTREARMLWSMGDQLCCFL